MLGHVIASLLVSMTSFRFEPVRYIQSATCLLLLWCEVAILQYSNALFSVCETRIFTVSECCHRRYEIHVDIQTHEPILCSLLLGTYDITEVISEEHICFPSHMFVITLPILNLGRVTSELCYYKVHSSFLMHLSVAPLTWSLNAFPRQTKLSGSVLQLYTL
jgi:hypothetical protein